jgi:hypothetical protein
MARLVIISEAVLGPVYRKYWHVGAPAATCPHVLHAKTLPNGM